MKKMNKENKDKIMTLCEEKGYPLNFNLDLYSDEEGEYVIKTIENFERYSYPKVTKNGIVKDLKGEGQHVVPRIYLDYFTENNDGLVYQYDLKLKRLTSQEKILTKNILKENDVYVVKDKDGKQSYFFEKFIFADYIEGNIKTVINKILSHESLIEKDYQILSAFVAYQYVRTPSFLDNSKKKSEITSKLFLQKQFRSFEEFDEHYKIVQREMGFVEKGDIHKIYEYIIAGKWNINIEMEGIVRQSMKHGNDLRPNLLNAHYEILETRKSGFFICSDNPFFIIPSKDWPINRGVGVLYPPEAERIIPLNQFQCLRINPIPRSIAIHGVSINYKIVNQKEVDRINKYICKNADRFIISKNKEYLISIINQIDFNKVAKDKNRLSNYYDDNLEGIVSHQFYPY